MYEIDKVKFGAFISELRKEKGITQKELAQQLYLSDKAISKWETGHSVPDITLLVPLAEILEVTVTELLECRRIEQADTLNMAQTDDLVKKVIGLSEEEALGRPRLKKKHVLIYVACVVISIIEILTIYQLQDELDIWVFPPAMIAGMAMFFGIYFWFFIREKLPAYYDEYKVNVYVDGMMHMNLMGVYFNNHNWPHIVKAFRIWSVLGMTVFPVIDVLWCIIFSGAGLLSDLGILLFLVLGGLFIPTYVLGRKYQYQEGTEPEARKGTSGKKIISILALAIFVGIMTLGGVGTMRSGNRVGYTELADRNSWSANYLYLDGFMQRNLWKAETEEELHIAVETMEGTIAIEIKDEEGNVIFSQENMETGRYEAPASEKYVVRVTAEEHKGSFYIGD